MAIISIFLATLLATGYANGVNPVEVVSGTPAVNNVPLTGTPADTQATPQVAQQQMIPNANGQQTTNTQQQQNLQQILAQQNPGITQQQQNALRQQLIAVQQQQQQQATQGGGGAATGAQAGANQATGAQGAQGAQGRVTNAGQRLIIQQQTGGTQSGSDGNNGVTVNNNQDNAGGDAQSRHRPNNIGFNPNGQQFNQGFPVNNVNNINNINNINNGQIPNNQFGNNQFGNQQFGNQQFGNNGQQFNQGFTPVNAQNPFNQGFTPQNNPFNNPNNINNINNQFGNQFGNNQGLTGNNQGFINSAAQLVIGTYQWIGQDSSIYTLFVCGGLPGDRFIYAAIHRTNINAFGLPDNSYTWAFIVARGIVTLGADGVIASLRGFRLSDAFGVDTNFQLLLTYSRCDNLYQLQINDETYTTVKISMQNPQQQQCMRPSYVHNFNNLGGRGGQNNMAQFQSMNPLFWRMPANLGLGNVGFNNILTLRAGMFNNQFGVFGCGGFQNPLNNQFFPGYRRHFGNFGPFGNMFWNNALMVNAFDDDMFEMDFDWDCDRGIEFGLFLDDGDFWENQQCWNTPNIGWAGRMLPIAPMPGFGLNQCPMPNLAGLNPRFFPGWTPFPMQGFFGW